MTTDAVGWAIFSGWSGAASGFVNTTITLDGDKAVTATFIQNSVYFDDVYGWQWCVVPGNGTFPSGTVVEINATECCWLEFCGLEWCCFG